MIAAAKPRPPKVQSQIAGTPLLDPFGYWLSTEIEQRGWTVTEFANRSGIDRRTVTHWYYRARPAMQSCWPIAEGLGIPVWRVLEIAGYPSDGLTGVPAADDRREIMRKLERATPEVRRMVRDWLRDVVKE